MADRAIELDGVVVERGGRRILDHCDVGFENGRITVLSGASGSGKTSLLRLVNRLDVPAAGVVRYRGADVAALDVLDLRRRVGMVFQRPTPFPGTVRANLEEASHSGDDDFRTALEQAALPPSMLDRDTAELSGGELQRVCLARTLVTKPEALLLDEPTTSLDEESAGAFESAARGLAEAGTTIVWVTHDRAQLARVADIVIEMSSLT